VFGVSRHTFKLRNGVFLVNRDRAHITALILLITLATLICLINTLKITARRQTLDGVGIFLSILVSVFPLVIYLYSLTWTFCDLIAESNHNVGDASGNLMIRVYRNY